MELLGALGVFVISFLLGSIPWGVIISKVFYHTDIREHGSGNIGTTNAMRTMGKVGGSAVFVLDFGKGIVSGLIAAAAAAMFGGGMSLSGHVVGYDDFEVDYYALVGYESELAQSEAGERLMRKAKKEMISTIGQCMGVAMAFQDLRLRFDYLKAAMDVQMGINLELLKVSREIDEAYEKEDWRTLERMVGKLPERAWVE